MKKIAMLFVLVLLTSCAQVPRQANYPLNYQKKMQASEHWNELASRIAEKVQLSVSSSNLIFISDADGSSFGTAMRSFLRAELEKRGVRTTEDRNSSYELSWEVQRVFFGADRSNYGHGLPMAIVDTLQFIFIGGVDFDVKKPHSEIIVSFDLLKNEKDQQVNFLRDRDVYVFYINDAEWDNYMDIAKKSSVGGRFLSATHEYEMVNH